MSVALAAHDDLTGSPVDIVELHGNYFRRPQSEACDQQHHGVVAAACDGIGPDRLDEYVHLFGRQIPGQSRPAAKLPSINGVRALTSSTLFGLIAVTGLRISEALSLDVADVDLDAGVLTLRRGKLGKARLLPVSES